MRTKKRILLFLFVLFSVAPVMTFGETQRETDPANSFGGRTIEITYAPGDVTFETLEAALVFYDNEGKVAKTIGRLNAQKAAETHIAFQEELFQNGRTVAYKMHSTEVGKRIKGYDYVIEWVDDKDQVSASAYGKDGREVVDGQDSFMSKYPFFTIQYIKDVVLEGKADSPGDVVTYSAKYNAGRAFVQFSSDVEPMTDLDLRIAGYYFAARGIKDGLSHYHKKVSVTEDGRQFLLYIQDGLLPYVVRDHRALISYVALGFNQEIYPLLTGMLDIKE